MFHWPNWQLETAALIFDSIDLAHTPARAILSPATTTSATCNAKFWALLKFDQAIDRFCNFIYSIRREWISMLPTSSSGSSSQLAGIKTETFVVEDDCAAAAAACVLETEISY